MLGLDFMFIEMRVDSPGAKEGFRSNFGIHGSTKVFSIYFDLLNPNFLGGVSYDGQVISYNKLVITIREKLISWI